MGFGQSPRVTYVRAFPSDESLPPNEPRLHKELPPTPKTAEDGAGTSVISAWWAEIASMSMALAAIIALFAILRAYDGKTSPQWPSVITLNTLVAVFSTIMKACLAIVASSGIGQLKWIYVSRDFRRLNILSAYDDASRGFFGAVVLLWKLHGRQGLASIGALITVLLVATEPFQQAIIRYEQCTTTSPGEGATIPRANDYTAVQGRFVGAGISSIVPSVENGAIAGMFDPQSAPQASCRTGNCTWTSTYSTVGWCSTCEDLTDSVVVEKVPGIYSFLNGETNAIDHYNVTNVTTVIPNSINLTNTYDYNWNQNFMAIDGSANVNANPIPQATSLDILMAATTVNKTRVNAGQVTVDCTNSNNRSWPCLGYGAARCQLYPCVKTLNASMHMGILQETVLSTFYKWGATSTNMTRAVLDTHCISDSERTLLSNEYDTSQQWISYNITFPYPTTSDEYPASMAKKGCMYVTSIGLNKGLDSYIFGEFHGVVTGVYNDGAVQQYNGGLFGRALYNHGNTSFDRVDELFRNLSISLTNVVRQTASTDSSMPVKGTVQQLDTCVVIRWAWFSYSVALVCITLLYLLLLVLTVKSYRGWKSSILPLLFHGLDHKVDADEYDVYNIKHMRHMAGTMSVKLNEDASHRLGLQVQ